MAGAPELPEFRAPMAPSEAIALHSSSSGVSGRKRAGRAVAAESGILWMISSNSLSKSSLERKRSEHRPPSLEPARSPAPWMGDTSLGGAPPAAGAEQSLEGTRLTGAEWGEGVEVEHEEPTECTDIGVGGIAVETPHRALNLPCVSMLRGTTAVLPMEKVFPTLSLLPIWSPRMDVARRPWHLTGAETTL